MKKISTALAQRNFKICKVLHNCYKCKETKIREVVRNQFSIVI